MSKIVGSRYVSPSEYFHSLLRQQGYTAKSFARAYNEVAEIHGRAPITMSTVQSLSSGRRNLSACKSEVLRTIVELLVDDPTDSPAACWWGFCALCSGQTVPVYAQDTEDGE